MRRAEDFVHAGRLEDALDALCEARYLLEPTLEMGKSRGRYAPSEDLFTAEMVGRSVRPWRGTVRSNNDRGRLQPQSLGVEVPKEDVSHVV